MDEAGQKSPKGNDGQRKVTSRQAGEVSERVQGMREGQKRRGQKPYFGTTLKRGVKELSCKISLGDWVKILPKVARREWGEKWKAVPLPHAHTNTVAHPKRHWPQMANDQTALVLDVLVLLNLWTACHLNEFTCCKVWFESSSKLWVSMSSDVPQKKKINSEDWFMCLLKAGCESCIFQPWWFPSGTVICQKFCKTNGECWLLLLYNRHREPSRGVTANPDE